MQGMKFLMIGEDGRPFNHGIIAQKVTDERYLCTFARQPQVSRLCHVDEIATWQLFPTDEMMNAFITQLAKENPPNPPPGKVVVNSDAGELQIGDATNPPGTRSGQSPPRKKAKKKAKKKVAKKKGK